MPRACNLLSRFDARQGDTGAKARSRASKARRLQLERLEDRTLLSAGALDPSFGDGGRIVTMAEGLNYSGWGFGLPDRPSVAIQPDGKVLVARSTGVVPLDDISYRYPGSDFVLTRYLPDGTVDASFGAGGSVRTSFGDLAPAAVPNAYGGDDYVASLLVQSDGKVLVLGTSAFSRANMPPTDWERFGIASFVAAARYLPDGTLDTGFGTDGRVLVGPAASESLDSYSGYQVVTRDAALQPDGKIVVATLNRGLIRLDQDGGRDMVFGDLDPATGERIGRVLLEGAGYGAYISQLAIRPDGKIVAGGTLVSWDQQELDFLLTQLDQTGLPDPSFGTDGLVVTDFGTFETLRDDEAYALALRPDGGIVLGGWSQEGDDWTTGRLALAAYDAQGALDPAFGVDGRVLDPTSGEWDWAEGLALQPDGKIVTVGWATRRYTALGELDSMFQTGIAAADSEEYAGSVAVQADGKLITVAHWGLAVVTTRLLPGPLAVSSGIDAQLAALAATAQSSGTSQEVTFAVAAEDAGSTPEAQVESVFAALAPDSLPTVAQPLTITLDLGGATYQGETATTPEGVTPLALPENVTLVLTSSEGATFNHLTVESGNVIIQPGVTLEGLTVNGGTVTLPDGSVLRAGSPALIVNGGDVILSGATVENDTDHPTILVLSGRLTVRGSVINEPGGHDRAAVEIRGGALDLGTEADPGGNTLVVWGAGLLIRNLGSGDIPAAGNTFLVDGVVLSSGFAVEDRVFHALDAAGLGLVRFDAGAVFVTASSGSIQRGVDAVAPGGTVFVGPGLFADFDAGVKPLTVVFQGGASFSQAPDALDPTARSLTVVGTSGNDEIRFVPSGRAGGVTVEVNALPRGTFAPTGRLIASGGDGDDDLQAAGSITLPVWLHGGAGDDRLKGGDGSDLLEGGEGDDLLVGGGGRDLLIGGRGVDRMVGNADDDILIAGFTAYDASDAALAAVLAEWASTRSYADRVKNLRGDASSTTFASRANGQVFLAVDATHGRAVTVQDDGDADLLTGSAGQDWFLFNADGDGDASKKDKVTDLSAAEFAADLDFING